jgi:hypothetical protein
MIVEWEGSGLQMEPEVAIGQDGSLLGACTAEEAADALDDEGSASSGLARLTTRAAHARDRGRRAVGGEVEAAWFGDRKMGTVVVSH